MLIEKKMLGFLQNNEILLNFRKFQNIISDEMVSTTLLEDYPEKILKVSRLHSSLIWQLL